jgi:hypothetical protein
MWHETLADSVNQYVNQLITNHNKPPIPNHYRFFLRLRAISNWTPNNYIRVDGHFILDGKDAV